jgi:hypothetical protein
MAKPTDFFVGITDLFSIILPGASIAYVCIKVEEHLETDILGLRRLSHTNEGYIAFFVVSYLLGHAMDMVGAVVLDSLYDLTYAHWKRSNDVSFATWAAKTPGRLIEELRNTWRPLIETGTRPSMRLDDPLFREARRLACTAMAPGDRVYQWCRSWVALKSAMAFTEIERLQANSKFFRGMVTASVITAALSLVIHVPFGRLGAVVCLVLAVTSFLRFCDLRWKAVQQTYRFFIALKLEAAAFSEPALSGHTTDD